VRALQRHPGGTLVERRVVLVEETRSLRELGRDRGEVARLAARRDRRLPQREPGDVPELLDELRAADADQLQAFEVGRLGQQQVGMVVVSSSVYAKATMNGNRAIVSPTFAVSQNEIAGLVR